MTQQSPPRDRGSGGDVRETTQEVVAQAQEKVQEVAEQGNQRMRSEIDRRSTDMGDQAQSLAEALRKAARELEEDGGPGAPVVHQIADRIESVGGQLKDKDADQLLAELEGMARRRPWVAGGVGLLAGFAASRFLKASAGERYDTSRRSELQVREEAHHDLDSPTFRERETFVNPGGGGL
jgi:hypothetical protein